MHLFTVTGRFNQFWLGCLLFFMVINSSCRSSRELTYMSDIANLEELSFLNHENRTYLLRPGDILYVSIKSPDMEVNMLFNPEESGTMGRSTSTTTYTRYTTPQGAYIYGYEVNSQGMLQLPLLGIFHVNGKSLTQVEEMIQERAGMQIVDPLVKVKLINYKFTILGEVRSPGVYFNYSNRLSILDAIAMANGNTDFAKISKVAVIRNVDDEYKKTFLINLNRKDAFLQEGFYLFPNDYVLVEPDNYKNFHLNSQAISIMFSSLSLLLAVIGLMH